jgi:hypothetical protein
LSILKALAPVTWNSHNKESSHNESQKITSCEEIANLAKPSLLSQMQFLTNEALWTFVPEPNKERLCCDYIKLANKVIHTIEPNIDTTEVQVMKAWKTKVKKINKPVFKKCSKTLNINKSLFHLHNNFACKDLYNFFYLIKVKANYVNFTNQDELRKTMHVLTNKLVETSKKQREQLFQVFYKNK